MAVGLVVPDPVDVGVSSVVVPLTTRLLVGIGNSEVISLVLSSDVVVGAADSSLLLEVGTVLSVLPVLSKFSLVEENGTALETAARDDEVISLVTSLDDETTSLEVSLEVTLGVSLDVESSDDVSLGEVVTALCGTGGGVVDVELVVVSGSSPPGRAVSVTAPPGVEVSLVVDSGKAGGSVVVELSNQRISIHSICITRVLFYA
jgi:hypothetical protein